MPGIMNLFKVLILVQLFYAMCITGISYAIPDDARNHVTSFSEITDRISLSDTGQKVEESLERTTDMPVIELGALVFYSGNIILDLLLNFVFAIPEMLGLLVAGLTKLFAFDTNIFAIVELFASVVVIIMYAIGLIELLASLRAGRSVV